MDFQNASAGTAGVVLAGGVTPGQTVCAASRLSQRRSSRSIVGVDVDIGTVMMAMQSAPPGPGVSDGIWTIGTTGPVEWPTGFAMRPPALPGISPPQLIVTPRSPAR